MERIGKFFASLIANLAPKTYVPENGKSGTYIRKLRLWEVTDFFKKTYNKGRSTKQFFENYLYEEFEVIS